MCMTSSVRQHTRRLAQALREGRAKPTLKPTALEVWGGSTACDVLREQKASLRPDFLCDIIRTNGLFACFFKRFYTPTRPLRRVLLPNPSPVVPHRSFLPEPVLHPTAPDTSTLRRPPPHPPFEAEDVLKSSAPLSLALYAARTVASNAASALISTNTGEAHRQASATAPTSRA